MARCCCQVLFVHSSQARLFVCADSLCVTAVFVFLFFICILQVYICFAHQPASRLCVFLFTLSLCARPLPRPSPSPATPPKVVRHVLTTVAIMAFSLFCALSVPGVGIVWSICGSSVSQPIRAEQSRQLRS